MKRFHLALGFDLLLDSEALDLPTGLGVPAPSPSALQPRGLRISSVVDPSGVLWPVAERRRGVDHDG